MRTLVSMIAAMCLTVWAVDARPCSIDGCREGEFSVVEEFNAFPGFHLQGRGQGATVPANIPAILWRINEDAWLPGVEIPDATDVIVSWEDAQPQPVFSHWDQTVPVGVNFLNRRTFVLVPDSSLEPNSNYLISDMGRPDTGYRRCMQASGSFRTTAEAPLPQTLGILEMPETVTKLTDEYRTEPVANPVRMDIHVAGTPMCTVIVGAAATFLKLTLSEDALPWQYALYYTLLFDGEPWIYHPSTPMDIHDRLGKDPTWSMVYAFCGAPANECDVEYPFEAESEQEWLDTFGDGSMLSGALPAPGIHHVKMQAWLPGSEIILETPEIEIDIQCPERVPIPCETDQVDGGDEVSTMDDGALDSSSESGCSTSDTHQPGGVPPASALLALLFLLAVVTRRIRAVRR